MLNLDDIDVEAAAVVVLGFGIFAAVLQKRFASPQVSTSLLVVIIVASVSVLGVEATDLTLAFLSIMWAYLCIRLPDKAYSAAEIPDWAEKEPCRNSVRKSVLTTWQHNIENFLRKIG
eukprot:m.81912 g.81912  ORF g.81912 m.81912 type:complete len:118 (+) comp12837_c0_seq4:179-532(+)